MSASPRRWCWRASTASTSRRRTERSGAPDIRPAGTFSENRGDETHVEGGGPEGAIILLSMQAVEGDVYDILREDFSLDRKITLDNFARGLERQRARAA